MWDTFYPNLQFLEKFSSQYTFGWGGGAITKLGRKILRFIYYLERVGTDYLIFFRVIICYWNGVSEYEKKT